MWVLPIDHYLYLYHCIFNPILTIQRTHQTKFNPSVILQTSLWTNQKVSSIGNLCYGKTAEQLKKIPDNVIEPLLIAMSPQPHNIEAQKRSLKSAVILVWGGVRGDINFYALDFNVGSYSKVKKLYFISSVSPISMMKWQRPSNTRSESTIPAN